MTEVDLEPPQHLRQVLATLLISRKLLTKVGKTSIIDFAGLLDIPSKIKLPKDITKPKMNAIRESLILIFFLHIITPQVSIKLYYGFTITIILINFFTIIRPGILKANFFLRFFQFCNTVRS